MPRLGRCIAAIFCTSMVFCTSAWGEVNENECREIYVSGDVTGLSMIDQIHRFDAFDLQLIPFIEQGLTDQNEDLTVEVTAVSRTEDGQVLLGDSYGIVSMFRQKSNEELQAETNSAEPTLFTSRPHLPVFFNGKSLNPIRKIRLAPDQNHFFAIGDSNLKVANTSGQITVFASGFIDGRPIKDAFWGESHAIIAFIDEIVVLPNNFIQEMAQPDFNLGVRSLDLSRSIIDMDQNPKDRDNYILIAGDKLYSISHPEKLDPDNTSNLHEIMTVVPAQVKRPQLIKYSPSGEYLAVVGQYDVQIINLINNQSLSHEYFQGPVAEIEWSPYSSQLAVSTIYPGDVALYHVNQSKWTALQHPGFNGQKARLYWAPVDNYLITLSNTLSDEEILNFSENLKKGVFSIEKPARPGDEIIRGLIRESEKPTEPWQMAFWNGESGQLLGYQDIPMALIGEKMPQVVKISGSLFDGSFSAMIVSESGFVMEVAQFARQVHSGEYVIPDDADIN